MTEQVLVVGAGASGLAVAAELGRRGLAYALVEASDTVASSWRGRYDSLRLHTARRLSGLPGAPLPSRYGPWVARDDLVTYLEDYARRFDVVPELGVEVTRIDRDGDAWRAETSTGPRTARAVVLATGYTRRPFLPDWPGLGGFTGDLVHSSAYRAPGPYAGRSVLVVGSGNSAAEIAVELSTVAATVELSVRTPPDIVRRDLAGVPSQALGIVIGGLPAPVFDTLAAVTRRATVPDLLAYGLPAPPRGSHPYPRSVPILDHGFVDAVQAGRISVVAAVEGFEGDSVRLADGSARRPDAVVAATGFRADLEPLVGHLGVLDGAGLPRVRGAATLTEAPELFFVGLGVELAGLLRRSGQEARAIGRALDKRKRPAPR